MKRHVADDLPPWESTEAAQDWSNFPIDGFSIGSVEPMGRPEPEERKHLPIPSRAIHRSLLSRFRYFCIRRKLKRQFRKQAKVLQELDKRSPRTKTGVVRGLITVNRHLYIRHGIIRRKIEHLVYKQIPAVCNKNLHLGPIENGVHDHPGVRISCYEFDEILGQGEFGIVYRGHINDQSPCPTEVAVKVVKKCDLLQFSSMNILKRLNIEIGLLRHHGHHPNIIKLRDVFHKTDRVYMIMEKATCTLDTLIEEEHHLSQPDLFQQVMLGILEPIRYLHGQGVCHGDIHPGNVLIQLPHGGSLHHLNQCRIDSSCIRLCDFGLAEISDHYDHTWPFELSEDDAAIYRAEKGGALGFTAPEVFCRYTKEMELQITDMWSIGCILLEMVHGLPEDWATIFKGVPNGDNSTPPFRQQVYECLRPLKMAWPAEDDDRLLHDLLFRELLEIDPTQRATAKKALGHAWFQFEYPGTFC